MKRKRISLLKKVAYLIEKVFHHDWKKEKTKIGICRKLKNIWKAKIKNLLIIMKTKIIKKGRKVNKKHCIIS